MATRQNILDNRTAFLTIRPDPDGSSDQWIQYGINGSQTFIMGSTSSDDFFELSIGNTIGTNNAMVITTSEEITLPLQPAFHAYLGSNDTNVTGDGTFYTIGTNVPWTVRFDQNSDFNTDGTFTAPISGKYAFRAQVRFSDVGGTNTGGFLKLTATNQDIEAPYMNPGNWAYQLGDTTSLWLALEINMDAGDTMIFVIFVFGGTQIIDLVGSGSGNETIFSGYLAV